MNDAHRAMEGPGLAITAARPIISFLLVFQYSPTSQVLLRPTPRAGLRG
jgi:hypothetical protein